ncbi:aldo/keto reductase [Allokutzneria albata]|uniref:Predicted oxidoreductase n=1 Tax=Allokutzneria albata TaxID=211114 RepID=A0A1G9V4F7_ALLAB|nr:aldo/keto reductase [Allokutzneria albata]SDM67072.1 Predicted oxidoreductase [Allokutzneria albata]
MITRRIGDFEVGAIGLGAMPLSVEGRPDRDRAVATVHAALDAGVTLIDTADSYHWHADEVGHNEELLAGLEGVLIATKGGRGRPGDGSWTVDASPEHLKRACEGSLRRLGVDVIDLYQLHKPDPKVPFSDSLGALAELHAEGKIRAIGLSNVDVDQIRQARELLGPAFVSVQNEFSPRVRTAEPELRLCAELGLAFLPWSPLGGISRSSLDGPSALPEDPALAAFHHAARDLGVSPQRVCLAWLLSLSPTVIPIPGATRPASIRDSAAAAEIGWWSGFDEACGPVWTGGSDHRRVRHPREAGGRDGDRQAG